MKLLVRFLGNLLFIIVTSVSFAVVVLGVVALSKSLANYMNWDVIAVTGMVVFSLGVFVIAAALTFDEK
jgi:hypothetical protein